MQPKVPNKYFALGSFQNQIILQGTHSLDTRAKITVKMDDDSEKVMPISENQSTFFAKIGNRGKFERATIIGSGTSIIEWKDMKIANSDTEEQFVVAGDFLDTISMPYVFNNTNLMKKMVIKSRNTLKRLTHFFYLSKNIQLFSEN